MTQLIDGGKREHKNALEQSLGTGDFLAIHIPIEWSSFTGASIGIFLLTQSIFYCFWLMSESMSQRLILIYINLFELIENIFDSPQNFLYLLHNM